MKKFFKSVILLASSALLLAGCAKEMQGPKGLDVDAQQVTFTASIPQEMTKAAADGDGAGASVNRCIMEIYYDGSLFARQYQPVSSLKATFTCQVVANRTYTVAFWADYVASTSALGTDLYYTTDATQPNGGLQAIALKGTYAGNDDKRDAFFAKESCTVAQAGTSFNVTLKRPFAQINVITTDWDKVATVSSLKPDKVDVTINSPLSKFNAVTGEASTAVSSLNYNADLYTTPASGTDATLSMDYLFASADKAVIDIAWKAQKTSNTDVSHSFTNIPYQRNYRTNIKGALLTTTGQWNVTVDPEWETPELAYYEAKIGDTKYKTLADAITAANANETVTLLADVTVSPAITISKNITLDMNNKTIYGVTPAFTVSGAAFTVKNGTASVDADLSVVQNGTTTPVVYEPIGAFRDAVNAGNAYSGYTVTVLKDIDLTDDTWVPIGKADFSAGFSGIFDGDNHKISLTKTEIEDDYGLFNYIGGGTQASPAIVRNLNLDIDLAAKSGNSTWIGGLVDVTKNYSRFENITVIGSLVTGKYGSGFIGWAVYDNANCVFENCTNKASITSITPSGGEYSIIAGICSQACGTVTFTNCRNEGVLTANHTASPTVESYIGHVVGKGNYSNNTLTITNCTFAENATITGWNALMEDNSYPFEGAISGMSRATYFETPNPGKLLVGGYFGNCTIDGVQQGWAYPNGVAHIQMTAAAYLSEDVASRGFYYNESSVYYKSKYDKGKFTSKANYSEQFEKDEYICYVPLTEMATIIGTFGDGFNSSLTWASGTPTAADWASYKTALASYTFTTDASSDACWSTSESKFVHIYGIKINDSLGKITIKTLPLGGGLGSATNHNIEW